jgi:hypothetical protein
MQRTLIRRDPRDSLVGARVVFFVDFMIRAGENVRSCR